MRSNTCSSASPKKCWIVASAHHLLTGKPTTPRSWVVLGALSALYFCMTSMSFASEPQFRIPRIDVDFDFTDDVMKVLGKIPIDPLEQKSTRNTVRNRLAKGGWAVIYGKEVGAVEYSDLVLRGTAAYLTGDTQLLISWFGEIVQQSIKEFEENAARQGQMELGHLARMLADDLVESLRKGRPVHRTLDGFDVEVGIATYRHEFKHMPGVPANPNSHQPYLRYRLTGKSSASGSTRRNTQPLRWVVCVYNPTPQPHPVVIRFNGVEHGREVPPNGWRVFFTVSESDVNCLIYFPENRISNHGAQVIAARPIPVELDARPELGAPYTLDFENGQLRVVDGRPIPSPRWVGEYRPDPQNVFAHRIEWQQGNVWVETVWHNGNLIEQKQLVRVNDEATAAILRDPNSPQVVRLNWNGPIDVYDRSIGQWRTNAFRGSWIP